MTDVYLQTPTLVLGLLSATEKEISAQVVCLLQNEDWVQLGNNFGGLLATWTVLERDSNGMPDLISFERHDGMTELYNPNIDL